MFDSSVHHQSREQQSSGFSWTGARSLLLTDWPAAYVHDTGGFGNAAVTALDPAADADASVTLADRSTRLVADLRLPGGRALQAVLRPARPLRRCTRRRGWAGGSCRTPRGSTSSARAPSVGRALVTRRAGRRPELTACRRAVRAGGCGCQDRGAVPVEWPGEPDRGHAPTGRARVEVRGGAPLDGRFLSGALLHLVTPQVRDAFLKVFRSLAALGPRHGRDLGAGDGPGAGQGERRLRAGRRRAGVAGDRLQQVLASFDLDDPELRVAGSAERFVIFNPVHGPVAVTCASAAFGRRLHEHAKVRAAAERTLTSGIFPAELSDGRPVALA